MRPAQHRSSGRESSPSPGLPALPTQSQALAIDVRALAIALRHDGLRALRRRGAVRADRLHAFSAGRFTLTVKAGRRTIAKGARSASGPAVCSLTARLTRRGRALLRRSRHRRLTLALAFTPQNGHPLVSRTAVRLTR